MKLLNKRLLILLKPPLGNKLKLWRNVVLPYVRAGGWDGGGDVREIGFVKKWFDAGGAE